MFSTRDTGWARDLLDQLPDALLVHSGGAIVFINRRGLALLGYDRIEDVIGRSPLEFVHPDEHSLVLARMRRMSEGGGPEPLVEERLVRRDGTVLSVDVRAVPVRYGDGPAVMALARDATERRHLQERGALADRMAAVGRLAAGVAHGINNPLAYVLANAGYAIEELGRSRQQGGERPVAIEDVRRALRHVEEGARRIQALVASLTTFARSGERPAETVDVRSVLDSALALAGYEIRQHARLVKAYEEVPTVRADASRLAHAFMNLLVNAAHSIEEKSDASNEIRVVTRTDAYGQAVVEVFDTGAGLPPEAVGSVFDPFFTTRSDALGVGLGLSIAYEIVASLGGTVAAESEPGRGSVFRVTLPAADPAQPGDRHAG
ncbi:MAG: PAS domain S-box protein [Deltaproteobacteria bacterium]|nr:PAS domain S-box protein [Deltaproteobacteria bacterium]